MSFGDVRRWAAEPLHDAERALVDRSDLLVGLADELDQAGRTGHWVGEARLAAYREQRMMGEALEDAVAQLAAVRRAVGEAADAVDGLRYGVVEAVELATIHNFDIDDAGTVHDRGPAPGADQRSAEEIARDRQRIADELADRVTQILRRAKDIDDDLTGVLDAARRGEIGAGDATTLTAAATAGDHQGGLSTVEPPRGGSPADNAGWWSTLSEAERRQLIGEHPDWLGNRNGLPAEVRDAANRGLIEREYATLQQKAAELRAELDGNLFGGTFSNADAGLEQVEAKLASLDRIREVISQSDRQLLTLDLTGERAEAAIAVGDVDTADHVSVFTPGLATTVDGDLKTYDQDMKHLQERSERLLRAEGRGAETVATVTWIGYQAPQWDETFGNNSVSGADAALRGADKLAPFLNGIDASRPDDPHLTALGHSYGSVTTGYALQQDTGVDDAVFFGSPGIGTRDVGNLQIPDGHAFNIEGRSDPVADMGQFGPDPSGMGGMNQLSASEEAGPYGPMTESAWHSYYLDDNSTSQFNMAAVLTGLPDNAIHDR
ncbi:alpha/beta hydrolase [Actinophytocola sediminis]